MLTTLPHIWDIKLSTTQNNNPESYEYGDEVMVEFERPTKRLQHMSTIQNIVLSMHHFISTCETDKFLRETAYVSSLVHIYMLTTLPPMWVIKLYTTQNNKSITIKLYEYGDEVMVEFERQPKLLEHIYVLNTIHSLIDASCHYKLIEISEYLN